MAYCSVMSMECRNAILDPEAIRTTDTVVDDAYIQQHEASENATAACIAGQALVKRFSDEWCGIELARRNEETNHAA